MNIFEESNKLGQDEIDAVIELFEAISVAEDVDNLTDRTTDKATWLLNRPSIGNLGPKLLKDGGKRITINPRNFKALSNVWYLDDDLNGQVVTRDTLYKYLYTKDRHATVHVPKSDGSKIPDPPRTRLPKQKGAICSNASAISYALADEYQAKQLFKDMQVGRSNWTSKELLAAMAIIKRFAQANPDRQLGDVEDIDSADYNRWLVADNDDAYVVGPYLLMKHAQQARALLKMEGDDITMTHGDETITVRSSFEFVGDGEKFAKGLKQKHRPLRYEYISPEAYLLSEIFHRFYNIRKTGDYLRAMPYAPGDAKKANLMEQPDLCGPDRLDDPTVGEIMAKIKDAFNASNASPSDTDVSIEGLARICEDYTKDFDLEEYVNDGVTMARDRMTLYDKVFDEASVVTNMLERAKIIKKAGAATSLAQAVNTLDEERDHRNVSNYMQYAYKNMASIGGNGAIPAADTILKGARIRSFLDDTLCIDYTHATLVGVAYGHMIEPLQSGEKVLKLVDKVAAANSKYTIEEGNIYAIARDYSSIGHGVIIDDTMTEGNVSEKEAKTLKLKYGIDVAEKMSGDWNKFLKFVNMPKRDITIISKFSLRNIMSFEGRLKELLFPKDETQQPYRHVSMVKFGKLHNCETFLVLSNHKEAPKTTVQHFNYDIVNNMTCVSMANKLIGLLASEAIPNGVLPRADFNKVWLRLVDSLPSKWTWYQSVYDMPVTYGSAITSSVDQYDIFMDLVDTSDAWADKKVKVSVGKPDATDPTDAKKVGKGKPGNGKK